MKQKPPAVSRLLLSLALLGMSSVSLSADNIPGFYNRMLSGGKTPDVTLAENPQYLKESGSCYFPCQPGLLPTHSWRMVMAELENYFDENAELTAGDIRNPTDYLSKNLSDYADDKRSEKIMKSLHPKNTPLRGLETPDLKKQHNKIIEMHKALPREMVQDNPEVGSLSKCEACHTKSDAGSFSKNEILIPGVGGWEEKDKR